jgi:CheY-like chemotaxis protein
MKKMEEKKTVILLVEDEEAHAMLTMRTLEEEGVDNEVHWVTDGEEALNYLFRNGNYADKVSSPRPDLVILDLRLPKCDGHEVLAAIKQSEDLKVIPVVVLTTSENGEDMTKAYSNHANSYLVKPLGFGEFSEMIRELRSYWLVQNRHPSSYQQRQA